jgi:hypothetical protein
MRMGPIVAPPLPAGKQELCREPFAILCEEISGATSPAPRGLFVPEAIMPTPIRPDEEVTDTTQ